MQNRYRQVFGSIFLATLLVCDQIIKKIFFENFFDSIWCNFGISFGIVLPEVFFEIVWWSLVGGIGIFVVYKKLWKENTFLFLGFVSVIFGGLSNKIDRSLYGCVIDYIPFFGWFHYNLADAMISIGIGAIAYYSIYCTKKANLDI